MRNILTDVISYKNGSLITKESLIDVTSNARNIIFENEVYHLMGIDGSDYEYHSKKNVIKVCIEEIERC